MLVEAIMADHGHLTTLEPGDVIVDIIRHKSGGTVDDRYFHKLLIGGTVISSQSELGVGSLKFTDTRGYVKKIHTKFMGLLVERV